jgi:D-alanyl-D-alanine carboxypeptidase
MIRHILTTLSLSIVILTATGCSLLAPESAVRPAPADLPYAAELQIVLDQALRDGQGQYDLGISAAVMVPGYKPWVGVAGYSHPGVPVTDDMLFNMGSIAKSFEAALALKLAEEGVLDLDQPISTWLPEHANVDGRITVRQLLNHSSGLYNVFEHPDFPWVGPDVDYGRQWGLGEVLDRFVGAPYGPPGYAQHYSSTNYLLLTAIIEQTTGAPVPDEVKRRFLEPLELDHTVMSMGELPPPSFTVAHPWVDVDFDAGLEDLSGQPQTWIATMTHPVLYSTPEDMARWMHALYHEGRVLSEQSLQEMLTIPETTLPDPEGGRYGLGVVDYSEILGTRVIGHGGSSLGYSAAALYLPEYGLSVAWSINTGESPPSLAQGLMQSTWSNLSQVLLEKATPLGYGMRKPRNLETASLALAVTCHCEECKSAKAKQSPA